MEGNSQLWDLEDYLGEEPAGARLSPLEIGMQIIQHLPEDEYQHIGVVCMTKNIDNVLLWALYTGDRGYCIEFLTEEFIKSFEHEKHHIVPIDYQDLETINFNNYITRNPAFNAKIPLCHLLSVKAISWAYEDEWRIILEKDNLGKVSHPLHLISAEQHDIEMTGLMKRNIGYDSNSIERIILSTLFFDKRRFLKKINISNTTKKYYFRDNVDRKTLFNFLLEIYQNYNDKIFQLDRDIVERKMVIKIMDRIKVLYLNDEYVTIERTRIKSDSL
jgi:hypothetical protein